MPAQPALLDSPPRSGPSPWWRDIAGSVADLGVLIPIAVTLIVVNGLSVTAVLVPAGATYLLAAAVYRVPVAVQPLKAFGAIAVAIGAGPDLIAAGALLMGLTFLVLGRTRIVDRLAQAFPRSVVRGVQLAVGLLFLRIAHGLVVGQPEPFVPEAAPLAAAAAAVLLAGLLMWRRGHWALALVASGTLIAAFGYAAAAGDPRALAFGPTPIQVPQVDGPLLLTALVVLVLPQIPLTFSNSCVAPADIAQRYFGPQARTVTPGTLATTMGAANVAVGAVSGMPLCHGAGGMSAHHAFGARTWRAPVAIGSVLAVLGLLFAVPAAAVLPYFPLSFLAALLLVAGFTHIGLLKDVRGWRDWSVVLVVGLPGAAGYLLPAVVLGFVVARLTGSRRPA